MGVGPVSPHTPLDLLNLRLAKPQCLFGAECGRVPNEREARVHRAQRFAAGTACASVPGRCSGATVLDDVRGFEEMTGCVGGQLGKIQHACACGASRGAVGRPLGVHDFQRRSGKVLGRGGLSGDVGRGGGGTEQEPGGGVAVSGEVGSEKQELFGWCGRVAQRRARVSLRLESAAADGASGLDAGMVAVGTRQLRWIRHGCGRPSSQQ